VRPLPQVRPQHDTNVDEFCELFAQHARTVGPLAVEDARRLVGLLAARKGLALAKDEVDPCWLAGGHPGLIVAVVQALTREGGSPPAEHHASHFALVSSALDSDDNVRGAECAKLWSQLDAEEQETAIRLVSGNTQQADRRA
jgi:hypothetical protein